jgi:predicted esterase
MNSLPERRGYLYSLLLVFLFTFHVAGEPPLRSPEGERFSRAAQEAEPAALSAYTGRYRLSDGSVLIVEERERELTLRPLFWRAVQPLRRVSRDTFDVEERTDRQATFIRDASGRVVAVKLVGFGDDGTFPRLSAGRVPTELLMAGRPREAASQMLRADPGGVESFVRIGRTLLQKFPSKSADAVVFFSTLAGHDPKAASIQAALGDAYMAAGQRRLALASYRRAHASDATNKEALRALRRLGALPSSVAEGVPGWSLPFSLDSLFAKPTRAEIRAVEAAWALRDLAARDVAEVARGRLNLGFTEAEVRIISHSVHGQKHYGAVIVPDVATQGKSPVILDLKGVSWDYFALDLKRLLSPKFMGREQQRFIYIVPSFRGEVLEFNGTRYISEGDRTDSWDGATDDALAFLNAALAITPQADASRIYAFGKSRGGSVALLAGIRDSRIKSVLDWSGPVDWFELMGTAGWTQQELVADGLLNKATPKEEGGQFIERFLRKSITGSRGLRAARLHMLASSPLYFATRLPRLQIHYGIEDEMVPLVNGQALARAMRRLKRKAPAFEASFHPNAGHDLDQRLAYRQSREFILSLLSSAR